MNKLEPDLVQIKDCLYAFLTCVDVKHCFPAKLRSSTKDPIDRIFLLEEGVDQENHVLNGLILDFFSIHLLQESLEKLLSEFGELFGDVQREGVNEV